MINLSNLGINQLHVSKSLLHFENYLSLKIVCKSKKYKDNNYTTLFFGLYNDEDLKNMESHKKIKYLLLFGSDIEYIIQNNLQNKIINLNFNNILAMTENNIKKLKYNGVEASYFFISLYTETISKSLVFKNKKNSKNILIYNGFSNNNTNLYGKNIYDELVKKLDNYVIFYSFELIKKCNFNSSSYSDEYLKYLDVVSTCFVGIQIYNHNETINKELENIGIPLITSSNIDDILKKINDIQIIPTCKNIDKAGEMRNFEIVFSTYSNKNNNDNINNNQIFGDKIDDNYFNNIGINQCVVSLSLKHFETRFMEKYNLKKYSDIRAPVIYFGIYCDKDIHEYSIHCGKKYIIFGGSDINFIEKQNTNFNNAMCFSISQNIKKRLDNLNIKNHYIQFSLLDKKIFKSVEKENLGSKIYIYNGYSKNQEDKYGKKIYEEVMKKLPQYEYILSNTLNVPYEKMPEIYSQCFIGLRLTQNDGNANTVQEMVSMKIPIVHNGEQGGIAWNNVDDVVNIIERHKYNYLNKNKYDFYDITELNETILQNVKNNINLFSKQISQYKNILFICGDYPGYGGAATNCNKLQEYYQSLGHNTFAFYYLFEKNNCIINKVENNYLIGDLNEINLLNFSPDLIILKSFIDFDLKKKFNCPIYYLLGGIYNNNLNEYYYNLKTKEDNDKYINQKVLKQINNSDYSFANSSHTQKILEKYYNKKTYLFYSSFVPFINKKILCDVNFENRQYNYGLIVSNFDRKIKNIEESINFLKDKEKVILRGKNSKKYEDYGFKCVDLFDNNEISDYYKNIKYIVQTSFYESCSNVKIESIFNGCKLIIPSK
jgi:hypothetical protein